MYTNRRFAQARVLDYYVMQDVMMNTRDLRVSILCAGTSQLCLSHVVRPSMVATPSCVTDLVGQTNTVVTPPPSAWHGPSTMVTWPDVGRHDQAHNKGRRGDGADLIGQSPTWR
jgi:hypothetical protein